MKRLAKIVLKSEGNQHVEIEVVHGFFRLYTDFMEFYTDKSMEKMLCVVRMEHVVYSIFEDISANE